MDLDYLKTQVRYEDGHLYWTEYKQGRSIDLAIGSGSTDRYLSMYLDGKQYKVHRLIYLLHTGQLPEVVDHVNGNTNDNKIENLRSSTVQTNNYNRALESTSTSGVKGVCWHKRESKWRVQVGVNGKRVTVGSFDDLELAELVAVEYRNKHHGNFARHL